MCVKKDIHLTLMNRIAQVSTQKSNVCVYSAAPINNCRHQCFSDLLIMDDPIRWDALQQDSPLLLNFSTIYISRALALVGLAHQSTGKEKSEKMTKWHVVNWSFVPCCPYKYIPDLSLIQ